MDAAIQAEFGFSKKLGKEIQKAGKLKEAQSFVADMEAICESYDNAQMQCLMAVRKFNTGLRKWFDKELGLAP